MTNCMVRGTQRDRTYHQGNTIALPSVGGTTVPRLMQILLGGQVATV